MRQTDKDPESQPQSVQQTARDTKTWASSNRDASREQALQFPCHIPHAPTRGWLSHCGKVPRTPPGSRSPGSDQPAGFSAAQPQPRAPHLHRGLHRGHGLVQGRERGHGRHQHLVANQDVPLHQGLNQRRWGNGDVRRNLLEEKETERCIAGQQRDRIINAEK